MTKHYGDWNVLGRIVGKEIYVGVSSTDPSGLKFAYPVNDSEDGKVLKITLGDDGLKTVSYVDISGSSTITVTNGPSAIGISLANSGVVAGTYGSSSLIPVITVNSQGVLTSVSTVSGGGGGDLSSYTLKSETAAVSSGLQTQINGKISTGLGLAGTWNNVVVNADGIVTSGAFVNYSAGSSTSGITGDVVISGRVVFSSGGANSVATSPQMTFLHTTGFNVTRGTNADLTIGSQSGNASMSGSGNTIYGRQCAQLLTSGANNTFIGYQSGTLCVNGNNNVMIGSSTGQTSDNSSSVILLGTLADTDTISRNNAFVAGSTNGTRIDDVWFGTGIVSNTPGAYVIHGCGATGNNIAGASITIAGGIGTGSGRGGDVIFRTAGAVSTGGVANPLVTRLSVLQDGGVSWTGIITASEPSTAATNTGKIFYDSTLQKFRYSANGSLYADLVGSGTGDADFSSIAVATSNTTLDSTFSTVLVDAISGNVTVTIPTATTNYTAGKGRKFNVKRIDGTGNTVTIIRSGSDSFIYNTAGITSFNLVEGEGVTIHADGPNNRWAVI
jgi:hypothetical protein